VTFFRFCTVCLLAAVLTACSNTFVYNQLDWLIPWYVDDYVDLTRDQRQTLKSRVKALLDWHRSEELSSYIGILDRVEADLSQPVTGLQIEHWANLMLAAYERIEVKMLPVAFEMGAGLSDEQMAEFIDKLKDGQQELEEEYLERSDDEYIEEVREYFKENLGDFLGRLTQGQLDVIEVAATSLQRFDTAWLEERAQWIAKLSGLLQREPGWQDAVRRALEQRENNRTETYRGAYAHNAIIINDTIAEVLNLRTDKQDQRLKREIDALRRDFNHLIEQGT
jgi:hypothetical protein